MQYRARRLPTNAKPPRKLGASRASPPRGRFTMGKSKKQKAAEAAQAQAAAQRAAQAAQQAMAQGVY